MVYFLFTLLSIVIIQGCSAKDRNVLNEAETSKLTETPTDMLDKSKVPANVTKPNKPTPKKTQNIKSLPPVKTISPAYITGVVNMAKTDGTTVDKNFFFP
jgi:hypothetical protein